MSKYMYYKMHIENLELSLKLQQGIFVSIDNIFSKNCLLKVNVQCASFVVLEYYIIGSSLRVVLYSDLKTIMISDSQNSSKRQKTLKKCCCNDINMLLQTIQIRVLTNVQKYLKIFKSFGLIKTVFIFCLLHSFIEK